MTNKQHMLGHFDVTEEGETCHVFPVQIYWEDTDAGGIVYHANYLKFTERARSDLLRGIGIDQPKMMTEHGQNFVVRDSAIEFLKPAHLDETLRVRTTLLELKSASLRLQQDIFRGEELLIKSRVRVACLQKNGRPARFLPQIKDSFASLVNRSGATV
ncbi:tol-pal system-associated acyl-CoA thioesterase [Sneathiella glossodoripedis]|uniref:tol-pal system-associated acyl-CoA thioesterase n=1 Tax=Sneathiella glossodoripedis TaxID=418853 RepID=UPI000471EDB7|nr:tol-pal system-associated acyl-CoA thioesterase [Sneathiella glossodoripedis]